MANTGSDVIAYGTPQEQDTFMEKRSHYDRSRRDLDIRRRDFDKKDEMFRSYINPTNWPYKAQVADPSVFTYIVEKTSRLISNKLRGTVTPRHVTDWLKAKITNELLDTQWDLADVGGSMVQKWALMDHNARKYGSSFALCKWRYETIPGKTEVVADNPEFEVIQNRDFLYNPDHPEIRQWAQIRRYLTLEEMKNVNELARAKPVYKNLDILEQQFKEPSNSFSDRRDVNYTSRNKAIKGLQDTLGDDRYTKYIEVVTEYSATKIVRFAPKHGIILQEEDNPYGVIPIVHLKYYIIDDDFYGLSEIEPIEKLQKVENALISQYLDTVNTDLYPPILVRSTGVQLHTINFGPNEKWLVTDPMTDVKRFETSTAATGQFTSTISFIISRMQNAMGETSEGLSNINPTGGKKTATEIQDSATQRLARDNFNQVYLAEALKKQMIIWMKMNSKMITKNMILQITSSDALNFMKKNMLVPPPPGATDPITGGNAQPSPFGANESGQIGQGEPLMPVDMGAKQGVQPKFSMDETGTSGNLIVEPKDLSGLYSYIPDVESMSIQQTRHTQEQMDLLNTVTGNPQIAQSLVYEGVQLKLQDLITDIMEGMGLKDAKRYFESSDTNPLAHHPAPNTRINVAVDAATPIGQEVLSEYNLLPQGGQSGAAQATQVNPGTGAPPQGVPASDANGAVGGMGQGAQAAPGNPAQPSFP